MACARTMATLEGLPAAYQRGTSTQAVVALDSSVQQEGHLVHPVVTREDKLRPVVGKAVDR